MNEILMLINYGVLGIWTIVNVKTILEYRRRAQEFEDKMFKLITEHMIKNKEDNFINKEKPE